MPGASQSQHYTCFYPLLKYLYQMKRNVTIDQHSKFIRGSEYSSYIPSIMDECNKEFEALGVENLEVNIYENPIIGSNSPSQRKMRSIATHFQAHCPPTSKACQRVPLPRCL